MKVEVKSKKGLRTILSVVVDKKNIQTKMNERLQELQKEVTLKGFRPGKVPAEVIKSQFGKSIYGEVVDKILRETTTKAIDEKKLKVAGQPKIDLKQFGEGKDLNYELQIDCLPSVNLKSFDKFKATSFCNSFSLSSIFVCIFFLSTITDKIVLRPFFDFTSTFIIFWWARRDSNS